MELLFSGNAEWMNDFQRRPRVDSNLFLLVRKRQMIVTILKQFHARLHSHTYICKAWLWEVLNYPCLRFFCVWSLYGHNRGIKNANFYLQRALLKSTKKLFIISNEDNTYFSRTIRVCFMSGINCKFSDIFLLRKNMLFPSYSIPFTYLYGMYVQRTFLKIKYVHEIK